MAVNITYFVHGSTIDNENHLSSGWKDVELSELGIQQSKELVEQINNIHFDAVFCSDLKRAVDSAKLTFGDKVIVDKRLRECNYGDFNGRASKIVEPIQKKSITKRFSNGESYKDVKLRVEDFLSEIKEKYDGKQVAVVSHKAPQLALEVIINNKTWMEAFKEDWRKVGKWQPGWRYVLK